LVRFEPTREENPKSERGPADRNKPKEKIQNYKFDTGPVWNIDAIIFSGMVGIPLL
jgi:hypothetical protein